MKAEKIQWHPGFYAAFQIEFGKERRYLTFENEHQLSKKPMAIDILVIKKQPGTRIHSGQDDFLS